MKNFLVILAMLITGSAAGQGVAPIFTALAKGDVEGLSKYLDQNVEIHLLDKVSVYDKNLGKRALTKFFTQFSPSECTPIHRGTSKAQGSQYSIARLKTDKGNLRVYVFGKKRDGKIKIQELRIDRTLNARKNE